MSRVEIILNEFSKTLKPVFFAPMGHYPNRKEDDYKLQTSSEQAARLDENLPALYSWLGTPIFADVVLMDSNSGIILSLETVLVEVRNKKNIVKTPVQGLTGTFKEFISNGDYEITIRGGLFNINPFQYPKEAATNLIKLCNAQNELHVQSDFLNLFDVYDLVIEDSRFIQRAGNQSNQLFELKCVSDIPVELKMEEQ